MKTPEQLAVEWLKEEYGDTSNWTYMGQEMSLDAFYAGYQAAKPQWTSVYDALPETDEDVLWCNPYSGIVIVAPYNHKFSGELGEQYFTHWMVVPAMPKGEA